MKEKFTNLWNRIKAQGSVEQEFARLKTMYLEPQRFYHNMAHIGSCLTELDSVRDLVQQPDLVEFAIWYHDAIYNPKLKDNLIKSMRKAKNNIENI